MSSVRLMVLGVINSSKIIHGYKIYRHINSWRAETWTDIKPGSIYHALTHLEKKGLINNAGTKPDSGGPAALSYRINSQGREELLRLINDALLSYDQEEFAAGLAWMHLLTRREVLQLARQRLGQYEKTCDFMRTLPREEYPSTPDKHPEIIDSWTVQFDATAEWLKKFVAHIEAGKYRFKDES
ncbi:MAG TPA: PadR family transcriptional regulator [Candidatus Saccharimonadales bacterium]|nr:PadR family transcriptional regulator [Candidatus Saccharimonadales bacterium]